MEPQQIILTSIPNHRAQPRIKKPIPFRLFSLLVFITISIGIYFWFKHYIEYVNNNQSLELDEYSMTDLLELENNNSFEEVVLKYQFYRILLVSYTQPNIILAICILISFPLILNFIEKQSSTSIAFFQFNLISIYLQIWRLGMDCIQYFLTSKCTGSVWIHLLTKVTYYNINSIRQSPLKLMIIILVFTVNLIMIVKKDRLDLLIGVIIALVDITFMQGGTIKYPKDVFQEKEEWARAIKVDRLYLWQKFVWNQYRCNQQLCIDSFQFYQPRQQRQMMIHH